MSYKIKNSYIKYITIVVRPSYFSPNIQGAAPNVMGLRAGP